MALNTMNQVQDAVARMKRSQGPMLEKLGLHLNKN